MGSPLGPTLANVNSQFKSIFRNELQKAKTYLVFTLHTFEIYCNLI